MKTVYPIIIFSLFLFVVIFLPSVASAAVCQNKTAIVFSNGMFNIKKDSRDALRELKNRLISSSSTFADPALYEYNLTYASDGSQFVPQIPSDHPIMQLLNKALAAPNGIGQVGEVVFQKLFQDDLSAFIRWIAGKQAAGSTLQNIMNQVAAGANAASYLYTPQLNKQVNMYKMLLSSGKRVVIVSHSQGNFYANAAYSELLLANPSWANSVGNVQVSSPASANLAGKWGNNEPQITVNEDVVMNFIQSISFGQFMPRKPKGGGWSRNMQELGGSPARNAATFGHNFVQWYLAGTYTRDFIMKGIVDTINGVNGVGGLKYPTQGCTTPVAGVPIPQPGPFYHRDDWGVLTYHYDLLNSWWWVRDDLRKRFKNLRDDPRGLAYQVVVERTSVGSRLYQLPYKVNVSVTDYVTQEAASLTYTFVNNFKPDDVLLWSGGILFISYTGNDITWRKVSISDQGAGSIPRWSVGAVASGKFINTTDYQIVGYSSFGDGSWSYSLYPVSDRNQGLSTSFIKWNRVGVAYRVGSGYQYKIPYTATFATWTNAPSGRFGLVAGVNVQPPQPAVRTYQGDYAVLEIQDGSLSFRKAGSVALTDGSTLGVLPSLSNLGGVEGTMAYQRTQSFLQDAALVNEVAGPLSWRMRLGAGSLYANLPNGGRFFNPQLSTQRLRPTIYSRYSEYGQIFVPFSLSDKMSMLWASRVFSVNFTQQDTAYALGIASRIPRVRQELPIINRRGGANSFSLGVRKSVNVNINQKTLLESVP